MTSLIDLPEDVLINRILLKLDTNSLVNLRCVCKNLRSFITNPDFVKMHCHDQFNNNNNNNNSLVLVSLKKNRFRSLNFNGIDIELSRPERVEISTPFKLPWFIGSCNGLLCFNDTVEEIDQNPCLWNPSTKEYKKLPPPLPVSVIVDPAARLTHYFTYGFGYDRVIDDYKVIQCENFSFGHNSITQFQVYTLGTDTWRRIEENPYESYCMRPYCYYSAGMFVSGAVHWIGCFDREFRIIAFDIEKEMFRAEVPVPRSRLINHRSYLCSLNVLRGCLCIHEPMDKHNENWAWMNVWMMKEYGVKDSWTKLFTIKDHSAFQYPSMYDFRVFKFCESGEFLVSMKCRDDKNLILYDPINKKCRKVEYRKITNFKGCMEIHMQSLVSLKTGIYMGGIKKQVLQGKTEDGYAFEEEEEEEEESASENEE